VPARHLVRGKAGEDAALARLQELGLRILERNWRCKYGEVDVICLDRDMVVFVEVRSRGEQSLATPAQSVNRNKIAKLVRAASYFLSQRGWWAKPCRFDVISVVYAPHGPRLEHIPDAFDFPNAVGRGHTSWQPW
jgi:putative endonuclease